MGDEFSLNYNGTQVKKGKLAKSIAESICVVCNEAFNKGVASIPPTKEVVCIRDVPVYKELKTEVVVEAKQSVVDEAGAKGYRNGYEVGYRDGLKEGRAETKRANKATKETSKEPVQPSEPKPVIVE